MTGPGKDKHALVGTKIDERYELHEFMGTGTIGSVFRGIDLTINYPVAVKIMGQPTARDEGALKRFEDGVRSAVGLAHPNVVRVFAFCRDKTGQYYLVTDFVSGRTLGDELKAAPDSRLPLERVVSIFTQALDGLEHAHAKDVVHRNLKLNNLMLLGDGGESASSLTKVEDVVKVLDFAVAKQFGDKETLSKETYKSLATAGEGRLLYMSPEQCTSGRIDGRADIYALGCLLFETLTGRPPFLSESGMRLLTKHIQDPIPRLRDLVPDLKDIDFLQAIIDRATAKKADDRYQSAGEMRHDLGLVGQVTAEEWESRAVAARSPEQFRHQIKPKVSVEPPFPWKRVLAVVAALMSIPLVALAMLTYSELSTPELMPLKLAMQEMLLSKDDPRLLKTLDYLTEYYKSRGRYAEAWAYRRKFKEATEPPIDLNADVPATSNKSDPPGTEPIR